MNKLRERLLEAMKPDVTRADLSAAIKSYGGKISRAGMAKWFDDKNAKATMKAEHVFPVAARCNINPEWLATGKGSKNRAAGSSVEKLPPHRAALIQAYGSLNPAVRRPIRTLIETLAVAANPHYHEFVDQLAARTAKSKEPTTT